MPKISQLFELEYGHSLELNRLTPSSDLDAVNFVGRAVRNNGVTARVQPIAGIEPAPAGTLTVALNGQGGAGVAFLQPYPYYTGFHVMILKSKGEMTDQEKLWWATCITANRFRFGFGRQANRTLKNLVLPDYVPEWVQAAGTDIYRGADAPAKTGPIRLPQPETWGAFKLGSLFDIRKGQRLTKANMLPGEVPYVGASDSGNGVTARIGQNPIHDGGTISVSYNGSVAEAFYQPVPFWATDDVNVLYPLGFRLTPAAGLFISTVIRLEKYRFSYGRKWHLERMRESVIRLPVTSKGQPDFKRMESYIQHLPYSSQVA